jgi:hypothetical protein
MCGSRHIRLGVLEVFGSNAGALISLELEAGLPRVRCNGLASVTANPPTITAVRVGTATCARARQRGVFGGFFEDALYHGMRFRTFNVIDDFNREALAIEIDTSLRAVRLIHVFERLQAARGLPTMLRVDNGPELLG